MFSPALHTLLSQTYIDDRHRAADAARLRSDVPARIRDRRSWARPIARREARTFGDRACDGRACSASE